MLSAPVPVPVPVPSTELRMLMMSANGHVDPRGSLAPPIIMRTAATPMPTPKGSLGPESMLGFGDSRRGSNVSIDPNAYDQRSLVSGIIIIIIFVVAVVIPEHWDKECGNPSYLG